MEYREPAPGDVILITNSSCWNQVGDFNAHEELVSKGSDPADERWMRWYYHVAVLAVIFFILLIYCSCYYWNLVVDIVWWRVQFPWSRQIRGAHPLRNKEYRRQDLRRLEVLRKERLRKERGEREETINMMDEEASKRIGIMRKRVILFNLPSTSSEDASCHPREITNPGETSRQQVSGKVILTDVVNEIYRDSEIELPTGNVTNRLRPRRENTETENTDVKKERCRNAAIASLHTLPKEPFLKRRPKATRPLPLLPNERVFQPISKRATSGADKHAQPRESVMLIEATNMAGESPTIQSKATTNNRHGSQVEGLIETFM